MLRCVFETCNRRYSLPNELFSHLSTFCHHQGCQGQFSTEAEYEKHSKLHIKKGFNLAINAELILSSTTSSLSQHSGFDKESSCPPDSCIGDDSIRYTERNISSYNIGANCLNTYHSSPSLTCLSDGGNSPSQQDLFFSPESVMPLTPLSDFELDSFPPLIESALTQNYQMNSFPLCIQSHLQTFYPGDHLMTSDNCMFMEDQFMTWNSNQWLYAPYHHPKQTWDDEQASCHYNPLLLSSGMEYIDENHPYNELSLHDSVHTTNFNSDLESLTIPLPAGCEDIHKEMGLRLLADVALDNSQSISNIAVKTEPEDDMRNTNILPRETPTASKRCITELYPSGTEEITSTEGIVAKSGEQQERRQAKKRVNIKQAFRQLSEEHASADGVLDLRDVRYLSEGLLVCNNGRADISENLIHVRTFTCALCKPLGENKKLIFLIGPRKHRTRNRNKTRYKEPFSDPPVLSPLYFDPEKHKNKLLEADSVTYEDLNFGCSILRGVSMELSALPLLDYLSMLESTDQSSTINPTKTEDITQKLENYLDNLPTEEIPESLLKEAEELERLFTLTGVIDLSNSRNVNTEEEATNLGSLTEKVKNEEEIVVPD